jgi:hypothetical protein
MALTPEDFDLQALNFVPDRSQHVDEKGVDQNAVQRGEPKQLGCARQADATLPLGNGTAVRQPKNASSLALLEPASLAVFAELIEDQLSLLLCHLLSERLNL